MNDNYIADSNIVQPLKPKPHNRQKGSRLARGTTTVEITCSNLEKIKQIAEKKRMKVWGVMDDILNEYFSKNNKKIS